MNPGQGDVEATWNTRYDRRIRMEHWANALNQGQTAAAPLSTPTACQTRRHPWAPWVRRTRNT